MDVSVILLRMLRSALCRSRISFFFGGFCENGDKLPGLHNTRECADRPSESAAELVASIHVSFVSCKCGYLQRLPNMTPRVRIWICVIGRELVYSIISTWRGEDAVHAKWHLLQRPCLGKLGLRVDLSVPNPCVDQYDTNYALWVADGSALAHLCSLWLNILISCFVFYTITFTEIHNMS